MADNTRLLNSSVIYNIDSGRFYYFYDDPLSLDPSDRELKTDCPAHPVHTAAIITNLISEIKIIEADILRKTEKALSTEYEDSDDLTDKQRHMLDLLALNYVKLCGSC